MLLGAEPVLKTITKSEPSREYIKQRRFPTAFPSFHDHHIVHLATRLHRTGHHTDQKLATDIAVGLCVLRSAVIDQPRPDSQMAIPRREKFDLVAQRVDTAFFHSARDDATLEKNMRNAPIEGVGPEK